MPEVRTPTAFVRLAVVAAALSILSVAAGAGPAAAAPASPSDIAAVESGALRGTIDGDLRVFRGVPYAAPPVGDLRWRAPQPALKWQGVRDATRFGFDCIQPVMPPALHKTRPTSEDCLTLNVWAPAIKKGRVRLPVMVFIHGGAFFFGSSASELYDGAALAKQGVVVVTINYRLGRFGFFAHPALSTESPKGPLGNYALMDQIAALKWVKRNIASFGGDAGNVTAFGQSAGAISLNLLLTSPAAKRLFQKAIVQSGDGAAPMPHIRQARGGASTGGLPSTTEPAESVGLKFAQAQGIAGGDAAALKALRALPAKTVMSGVSMATPVTPMIDGVIVLDDALKRYLQGKQNKVPLIIGANSYEGDVFQPQYDAVMGALPEAARARALQLYDGYGTGDRKLIGEQFFGDAFMIAPSRGVARLMALTLTPTYLYHFTYVGEALRAKMPGAGHGSELPYVFGTLAVMPFAASARDQEISRMMSAYWVRFAKTGDPSGGGRTEWPRHRVVNDVTMEFGNDGARVRRQFLKERLDFIDELGKAAAKTK